MRRAGQVAEPDIAAYQRVLDRVFARSRPLLRDAPTWQAALFASVRGCYAEMRSNPEALEMHFVTTGRDERVQRTRTAHRDRVLALLGDVRDDVPEPIQAEMALTMIHSTMCAHVAADEAPPALDDAEQTFATLLFNAVPDGD
ncbi:hypothetical protein AB0L40_25205 [Patulibacter sp. NPDC049589]|uniref:hypothetical protein n=1 Tax=Patulibacter sp. NPDC049589 TaxID=3154731 RepID=UPI00342C3D15